MYPTCKLTGLSGPNGDGKSTCLKIIAGLSRLKACWNESGHL
ncbi:ATP-binding cassette domain-containing protein [Neomoorella carbonis]